MAARSREQVAAVEAKSTKPSERAPHPPMPDGAKTWRVFLVAHRHRRRCPGAYFLQPFKIPTGSMQPTLVGVVGVRTGRAVAKSSSSGRSKFACLGRSYLDVKAKSDVVVAPNPHPRYQNEGYLEESHLPEFLHLYGNRLPAHLGRKTGGLPRVRPQRTSWLGFRHLGRSFL